MAVSRHGTKVDLLRKPKDKMDSKTSCQSSLQTQQTFPVREVKEENSLSDRDTDCSGSESRGKTPLGKLQSYEEPGSSTCSTNSSEDEETEFWANKKRDEKRKRRSGKVRM